MPSTIILGAGVFGASTAYHLIREHPDEKITLIDRTDYPCQDGASWDWSKVIRADYEDEFYMSIALEALDMWYEDPLFSKYAKRTGAAWINEDPKYPERLARNYDKLDRKFDYEVIKPKEMSLRYGGLFGDTNWDQVGEIFVNHDSGLADARRVLKATIDNAVQSGVSYKAARIKKLILTTDGTCTGVESENGEQFLADRVILCTGANTAKILADSAPDREELQAGDRWTAAGVVTGFVRPAADRLDTFTKAQGPVFVHNAGKVQGETMPPVFDSLLKFNRDISFTNVQLHEASGQKISAVPSDDDYNQWSISAKLKDELVTVKDGIYGKLVNDQAYEEQRYCWDGISPDANFFICPHTKCKGLYIATIGSFHGWKMLPVIGKYVVQMLDGKLSKECEKRWSWDRSMDGEKVGYQPQRDYKDLQ